MIFSRHSQFQIARGTLLLCFVVAVVFPLSGQTIWDGTGGNNNWSTRNNWNNNIVAANPSAAVLNFAGTTRLAPVVDANWMVAGINFNNGAGAFVISSSGGSTLTINGSGVVNADGSTQTLNSLVALGANQTWSTTSTGDLTIGGTINTAGFTLSTSPTVSIARIITLSGAISGSGGLAVGGVGTTLLSGANSYTGTTTISSGTLQIGNAGTVGTLGTGGNVVNNSALVFSRSNALAVSNIISGTGTVTKLAGGSTTLSGANTYAGTTTVTAGILKAGVASVANTSGAFGNGSAITLSNTAGVALDITGFDTQIGSLAGGGGTGGNVTLGAATLTVGDTTSTSFGGVVSGTGSITKVGSGTLTLAGANSYSGVTNVNAGTLAISADNGLGTAPGAATAGELNFNGGTLQTTSTFALSGNRGVDLGPSGGTFLTDASTTLTYSGIATGSGSVTKNGAGTLILSGANSYSGATTINAGTLQIGNAGTTGTFGTGGVVNNSAITFNRSNSQTIANGISGTGSLTQAGSGTAVLTGANTYSGTTTISAGTLQVGNAGTSGTLGSGAVTNNATLAFNRTDTAPAIANAIGGTGALTQGGTGTTILTGANTYAGITTISAGALQIGNAGTTGTFGTGGVVNNSAITFNRSNSQTIANGISGTGSLTQAGSGTAVLTGANTYSGTTTISAGTLQVGNAGTSGTLGSGAVTNNAALVFNRTDTAPAVANVISGTGTLTQAGTGTTTLSGANTFTGGVAINAGGTLSAQNASALGGGTAGTTVASGGALNLQSAGTLNLANNGTLSLAGTGVSGGGALNNSTGNNSWLGNITLTADTTIKAAGGTLNLGNISSGYASHTLIAPVDTNTLSLGAGRTLTLSGSGTTIWVNSRITESSSGNVIIDNAGGTVNYNPYMNSYTGTTTVKAGTLNLLTIDNQEPGNPTQGGFYGINGPLVIGDGVGTALSAAVGIGLNQNEVLNFTTAITMNSDGLLSLNAVQTISALTFNGGKIDIATGGLYLDSTVTVTAATGNVSSIDTAATGQLSLSRHFGGGGGTNSDRVFNIGDATGSTASDLNITAQVVAGGIVKNGIGTMTLGGTITNTYERATVVNNGTLALQKNTALGGATGVAANGTTVNGDGVTNGTLQLQNNITVTSENLYLNNTGYNNQGALNNASGNNTWAGYVELQSDARIQSDSGLLTLSGTVYTPSFNLDVRGIADTTISGSVAGAGNLVKNDSGKLILSGNNTFSGTTIVNAGILSMQNNAALGGLGATTINSGAVLQLDSTANGNLFGGDTTTTVSGTGIGGTGVVRNVLGNNTYTGQLTLAAASLVTANTGTTLTLSGGTTGTQNLTVGTTVQNGNVVISGAISNGTGQLTKAGSGDLTFGKSTGVTGTVGATHLNAGTLTVGIDGGTQSLLNTAAIDSALGTTLKIASTGKIVANYASGNTDMFGVIGVVSASGGTFEKTGAGTLTFNTTFNFAGNLILSGGTLALANSANVTFANIFITANTTIDFGSGTSTILSSANLYIAAGVQVSVINWVNNGAGGSDDIWYATNAFNNYTGTPSSPTTGTSAVLDATNTAPENQITFTGIAPAANTSWVTVQGGQYYDHEIRPIPEPSTYGALFLGGCLGFFGWRRYRRAAASRR